MAGPVGVASETPLTALPSLPPQGGIPADYTPFASGGVGVASETPLAPNDPARFLTAKQETAPDVDPRAGLPPTNPAMRASEDADLIRSGAGQQFLTGVGQLANTTDATGAPAQPGNVADIGQTGMGLLNTVEGGTSWLLSPFLGALQGTVGHPLAEATANAPAGDLHVPGLRGTGHLPYNLQLPDTLPGDLSQIPLMLLDPLLADKPRPAIPSDAVYEETTPFNPMAPERLAAYAPPPAVISRDANNLVRLKPLDRAAMLDRGDVIPGDFTVVGKSRMGPQQDLLEPPPTDANGQRIPPLNKDGVWLPPVANTWTPEREDEFQRKYGPPPQTPHDAAVERTQQRIDEQEAASRRESTTPPVIQVPTAPAPEPGTSPEPAPKKPDEAQPVIASENRQLVGTASQFNPTTNKTYWGVTVDGKFVDQAGWDQDSAWRRAFHYATQDPEQFTLDPASVGPLPTAMYPTKLDPQHPILGPANLPRDGALSIPAIHKAYIDAYATKPGVAGPPKPHAMAFQLGALGLPFSPEAVGAKGSLVTRSYNAYMAGQRYRDVAIQNGHAEHNLVPDDRAPPPKPEAAPDKPKQEASPANAGEWQGGVPPNMPKTFDDWVEWVQRAGEGRAVNPLLTKEGAEADMRFTQAQRDRLAAVYAAAHDAKQKADYAAKAAAAEAVPAQPGAWTLGDATLGGEMVPVDPSWTPDTPTGRHPVEPPEAEPAPPPATEPLIKPGPFSPTGLNPAEQAKHDAWLKLIAGLQDGDTITDPATETTYTVKRAEPREFRGHQRGLGIMLETPEGHLLEAVHNGEEGKHFGFIGNMLTTDDHPWVHTPAGAAPAEPATPEPGHNNPPAEPDPFAQPDWTDEQKAFFAKVNPLIDARSAAVEKMSTTQALIRGSKRARIELGDPPWSKIQNDPRYIELSKKYQDEELAKIKPRLDKAKADELAAQQAIDTHYDEHQRLFPPGPTVGPYHGHFTQTGAKLNDGSVATPAAAPPERIPVRPPYENIEPQTTLTMPGKNVGGLPAAEIRVGQGKDGKFYHGTTWSIGDSAYTGPISEGPYDTLPEAIGAASASLRENTTHHLNDAETSARQKKAAQQILKWLDSIPVPTTPAAQPPAAPEAQPEPPARPTSVTIPSFRPDTGAEGTISVPGRAPIKVRYGLAEADDLTASNLDNFETNPAYPPELQPRQRERAGMQAQISKIADPKLFEPSHLAHSSEIATGAPMVGPDGIVESGNGRVMALRRIYMQNGASRDAYLNHLRELGYNPEGMRNPVLVRVRQTPLTNAELVPYLQDANTPTVAGMSAAEQSGVDASKLSPDTLGAYRPGALTNTVNAPFVRAALAEIASPAELNKLVSDNGTLSAEGHTRLQAALTHKAYGDASLVQAMFEDPNPDMGTLGKAAVTVAPAWALMRMRAAAGQLDAALDPTEALNTAFRLVRQQREGTLNIADKYGSIDAFADQLPEDPRVKQFLDLFFRGDTYRRVRAGPDIAVDLQDYTDLARREATQDIFAAPGKELSEAFLQGLVDRARKGQTKGAPEFELDSPPGRAIRIGVDRPDGSGVPDNLEVTTFHGTRHLFEGGPSDEKIKTGEGHLAYGYGHYSAQNAEVAHSYRMAGGPGPSVEVAGVRGADLLQDLSSESRAKFQELVDVIKPDYGPLAEYAKKMGWDAERSVALARSIAWISVRGVIRAIEEYMRGGKSAARAAEETARYHDSRMSGDIRADVSEKSAAAVARAMIPHVKGEGGGHVYRWELPDHADYLDHDKPLTEQSPPVQAALQRVADQVSIARKYGYGVDEVRAMPPERQAELLATLSPRERADITKHEFGARRSQKVTGQEYYDDLASRMEGHRDDGAKAATRILREEGVAGLTYLDQFSRPAAEIEKLKEELVDAHQMLRIAQERGWKDTVTNWEKAIPRLEQKLAAAKAINPTYNYVTFDPNRVQSTRLGEDGEAAEPETLERTADTGAAARAAAGVPEPETVAGTKYPGSRKLAGRRAAKGEKIGGSKSNIARTSELMEDLRRALGVTVYEGRVKGNRGTMGYFNLQGGHIRNRFSNDFDTFAHEVGHHFQLRDRGKYPALNAAIAAHLPELEPLDYETNRANRLVAGWEGFAEFFRYYMTNPELAKQKAPNFYRAFQDAIDHDDPKMAGQLRAVRAGYDAWVNAHATQIKLAAPLTHGYQGGVKAFMSDAMGRASGVVGVLFDEAYRLTVDELNPIKVARDQLIRDWNHNKGVRHDLRADEDPYKLARMAVDAYAAGHADLLSGVHGYHSNTIESPSLSAAIDHALGRNLRGKWSVHALEDFGEYLIARRSVQLWDRYYNRKIPNPPNAGSLQRDINAVADYEAANPTWRQAAQMVYEYNRALWDKTLASGKISRAIHTIAGDQNPDHVPFARDMTDRVGPGDALGSRRGGGNRKFAGGARRIKGSFRQIINPIKTIMRQTYELNQFIAQNDTLLALQRLAKKAGPGASDIIHQIPGKDSAPVHFDLVQAFEALAKSQSIPKADIDQMAADITALLANDTTATLWTHRDISEKGEPILYVWKGGEKYPLRLANGVFGKQLYRALAGMDKPKRNLFVALASIPANFVRAGVVTHPVFLVANYIRGELNDALNTLGFIPFVSGAFGAAAELVQGKLAPRYSAAKGVVGGTFVKGLRDASLRGDVRGLNNTRITVKRFTTFEGFMHTLELSEPANRLGIFRVSSRLATKAGLTPYQADAHAAFIARDVRDYGRHGAATGTLARIIPFWNAAVQGIDKNLRTATADWRYIEFATQYFKHRLGVDAGLTGEGKPAGVEPDLTPDEKARMRAVHKIWIWSMLAAAVSGVYSMTHADDPEYQEIPPSKRGNSWWIKYGDHKWASIPKGFESFVLSDAAERAAEAIVTHNPKMLEYFLQDTEHLAVPPGRAPVFSVPLDIAANKNAEGAPIIPAANIGMPPEMQVSAWTSEIGKYMGQTLHVPPADVDYVLSNVGGSWGITAEKASNLLGPPKPPRADTLEDNWFTSRFFRDPMRGAMSTTEFYANMAPGGKLAQVKAAVDGLRRDGRDTDIATYVASLPGPEKVYAETALMPPGFAQFHPMNRAAKVIAQIGAMRRELRDGTLTTLDGQHIHLDPEQMISVDRALERMGVFEERNALKQTGVPGWSQKAEIPYAKTREELRQVSPQVAATLADRTKMAGVLAGETNERLWRQQIGPLADRIYNQTGPGLLATAGRASTPGGKIKQLELMAPPDTKRP